MFSQSATSTTAFTTALLAALAALANAHSWVEEVYRIAPNGTMVGAVGYPRGWVARTSTDPVWKDAIPQWLLPVSGQSAYSGDEILNKYEFSANPAFPMLQAAAGDHVALIHLENGHTTLPQNQPNKPHNRGTIFFYGTSDPKPQERLFDVHLRWNRDGTGGDKRGTLLGTRNYDDGQCYQPNPGPISNQRAQQLAPDGAVHDRELRCQSDIQLPDDLKPGSTYTIYWYWDWPDLNAANINMDQTTNGIYPWAGTFMRGEKDPHGFTMAAISRNESYASTVDIKIIDKPQGPGGAVAKAAVAGSAWRADQNIYTKAIKEQMSNNFQVDIDANQPAGGNNNGAPSNAPGSSAAPSSGQQTGGPGDVTVTKTVTVHPSDQQTGVLSEVTVTKTVTVPPSTVISTVYVTKTPAGGESSTAGPSGSASSASPSSPMPSSPLQVSKPPVYATVTLPASSSDTASTVTVKTTVMVTVTEHVSVTTPVNSTASPSPGTPSRRRRAVQRNW